MFCQKHADKAVLNEGYQTTQQIPAAAERLDIHQQASLEEEREGGFPEFEGLECSNVQSVESCTHDKEGVTEGLCISPSSVREFEEEKQEDVEEELAAQYGKTEDKIEEKQEEQDIIEGALIEEDREERIHGYFPDDEAPEVSNLQNLESLASYKAGVKEGLQAPASHSTDREIKDIGEDNKQEEGDITEGVFDFKDEQKQLTLCVDATSSHTSVGESWTSLPPTYEYESLDAPSYDHPSIVPFERQGQEPVEDRNERVESSHMHPLEGAWRELPAIQIVEPDLQAKMAVSPHQIVEKPWEDALSEQHEIDTPFTEIETQEHIREEPKHSSEKDLSLESKGMPDQKDDVFFPAESFERQTEKGEPSGSSLEGHGQWRKEAFAKESGDDVQPQPALSFEAESPAEQEEGYPSEATSSAVPPPHVSHGDIKFQV